MDVGFYYMANAAGRLLGTLLSGLTFQVGGLPLCLVTAAVHGRAELDRRHAARPVYGADRAGMSAFERYLTAWVGLAMVAGIVLGVALPGLVAAVAAADVANVNLVVAVLIWVMVYPMMVGVARARCAR